jgi:flagellar basal body rod protein FlgC
MHRGGDGFMKKKVAILGCLLILGLPLACVAQEWEGYTLENAYDISQSGVIAFRLKLAISAKNVANMMTMKDQETGLPYQKKYMPIERQPNGVARADGVVRSQDPFGSYFDEMAPDHTSGQKSYYPNFSMPNEVMDVTLTKAIYEGNVMVYKKVNSIYDKAIELVK